MNVSYKHISWNMCYVFMLQLELIINCAMLKYIIGKNTCPCINILMKISESIRSYVI